MKFEVLKENFQKGLLITERVVGKNLSLPILENILIKTEKNFLSLTATNLETAIEWWVLANTKKEGKTTVPAHFLSSFISLLPKEKIEVELKKNKLFVACKNYETQIQTNDSEEFPLIPQIENLNYFEVENKVFCEGLSQLVEIISPSQTRPEISGVYFSFQKDSFKLVATDSFRLAEKTIKLKQIKQKEFKECSFILPQKPAKDLINILGDISGKTKIYFSPNQVVFECPMEETDRPQVRITSRLVDGDYPNYQEIIPNKFKTSVILDREDFINKIKTTSLFSGKINEVKIKVMPDKKKVEILANDPDIGESKSSILGKIKGEKVEISYNYKFLLDSLTSIKSSEIIFELSEGDGPSSVKPVGDISYLHVVMPIKTS